MAMMAIFMTSAAVSRTNWPFSTVPWPPTPVASIASTTTRTRTDRKWVHTLWRASMNRSRISRAKAPPTSTSSGSRGNSSEAVGIARDVVIFGESLQLAGGDLGRQVRDRRFHQVGQRLGPQAEQQGAGGEHAQHQHLTCVDVLQRGHVGVADFAEEHA